MNVNLEAGWKEVLFEEFEKPYFENLVSFIKDEYSKKVIFPPGKFIFKAFDSCPFHEVKVVILGQDPYHGDGQAHGLSFSVPDGLPHPPSLINIYKELINDLDIELPKSGNLEHWADQGVLLLNATLTVRSHQAGSHQGKGWEEFTDAAIKALAEKRKNLVFLLWGSYAQKKGALIDSKQHLVLKSPHPSPLSAHRGFLGCRHFSKTNKFLNQKGMSEITW